MKRVLCGIGGLACAATFVGFFATAHAQTEGNPPIVPFNDPTLNERIGQAMSRVGFTDGIRISAASTQEQKKLDLLVRSNDLSTVFQTLAKNSDLHIIMADDVKGPSVQVTGSNLKPETAIELLCSENNLLWGKVGKDTYLIVKQKLSYRVTAVPSLPFTNPQPPYSLRPYNGQPPQADQKNFRLWLLDRK